MLTVNEKSPIFMTVNFTDENGAPLVPTSVDWRLDDMTNNTEIVPWTVFAGPASTMTLTILGSNNVIDNQVHVKELHVFGIRVDDGLPGEGYSELSYNVLNLIGPT